MRGLNRNVPEELKEKYRELIPLFERVSAQKRKAEDKIYSLHEPEVKYISKGKEHKKFEFGNKVSIIRSITGVILGALSFRNEYDGHTIEASLEQVTCMTGRTIKTFAGDRGYRGKKQVNDTQILIPGTLKEPTPIVKGRSINYSVGVRE